MSLAVQCQHGDTLGHLCGPNKGDASMRVAGMRTVAPQSLVRAGTAGSVVARGGASSRGSVAVNRGVNSNLSSELAAGELDRSLPFNADQNA